MDNPDGILPNANTKGSNGLPNDNNNESNGFRPEDSMALEVLEGRRAPEGKDNDSLENRELVETKNETTYTTDVNGKVTVVHVVVTINGNGTLADLKKQRMQIRNSTSDVNSLTSPVSGLPDSDSVPTTPTSNDIVRFTGDTDEIVGYAKSKRCCVIQ